MPAHRNEKEPDVDRTEDQIQMDDQGPSYSSSINESTPGEITANRQRSLHEQEAAGESSSEGSDPAGTNM